jgi:hypothetical protein
MPTIMNAFLTTSLTPNLDGWLCTALMACALCVPYGVLAVDLLLARQPEWAIASAAIEQPIWPRVMTGIGGALLLAALVSLIFFVCATGGVKV